MKVTKEQLRRMAEEVECGMKVYVNRATLEFREVPDYGDFSDFEEEMEASEAQVEAEWEDYIVIEPMGSREGFAIMEEFLEEVTDRRLQESLINALNRKSPFANFKFIVEGSSHRQQWFDFRAKKYREYVKEELEMEGIGVEE